MGNTRIGGIIFLQINGELKQAKGAFSYSLGVPKKEMVVGADGVHGYKEMPQVPYIEGAITDSSDLDLEALQKVKDATVTIQLANDKTIVLERAVYASEGAVGTEEGEIEARFEGMSAREIPA